jgi:hypothetical protein
MLITIKCQKVMHHTVVFMLCHFENESMAYMAICEQNIAFVREVYCLSLGLYRLGENKNKLLQQMNIQIRLSDFENTQRI